MNETFYFYVSLIIFGLLFISYWVVKALYRLPLYLRRFKWILKTDNTLLTEIELYNYITKLLSELKSNRQIDNFYLISLFRNNQFTLQAYINIDFVKNIKFEIQVLKYNLSDFSLTLSEIIDPTTLKKLLLGPKADFNVFEQMGLLSVLENSDINNRIEILKRYLFITIQKTIETFNLTEISFNDAME